MADFQICSSVPLRSQNVRLNNRKIPAKKFLFEKVTG